jgi:hypothetical protein
MDTELLGGQPAREARETCEHAAEVALCAKCFEARILEAYLGGIATASLAIESMVRKESGQMFVMGHGWKADTLRELADRLKKLAEDACEDQTQHRAAHNLD